MLIAKCSELYHLIDEQKETPSKELEEKIQKLKEEIDRIIEHSYDSHGL